jgi:hypothetical protein
MGCTIPYHNYSPYRSDGLGNENDNGNYIWWNPVSFYPLQQVDSNIDVFYLDLGGKKATVYARSNIGFYYTISPVSQPVYCTVDVLYINGTKERIFEGDV